jgi:hypothetical protein
MKSSPTRHGRPCTTLDARTFTLTDTQLERRFLQLTA